MITQRMNQAIEYIESNLEGGLNIADVAEQACFSKYHFHRMFYASFKLTCTEYIRRRKLTLAAVDLQNSDQSVFEVALKYGYESPNAFTRAFRKLHGINPSQARSGSVALSSYKRISFPAHHQDSNNQRSNNGEHNMNYKIIDVAEFNILGRGQAFEFETFVKEGRNFWKQYVGSEDYQQLAELNQGRPGAITQAPLLSAYFPTEGSQREEFTDVLAIEASDNIDTKSLDTHNFGIYTVPAGTYAEFNCTYKTSMKTNREIYGDWFGSTGYERDGNKPDLVAYFPIAFRSMSEMRVRWWVPVVKK